MFDHMTARHGVPCRTLTSLDRDQLEAETNETATCSDMSRRHSRARDITLVARSAAHETAEKRAAQDGDKVAPAHSNSQ